MLAWQDPGSFLSVSTVPNLDVRSFNMQGPIAMPTVSEFLTGSLVLVYSKHFEHCGGSTNESVAKLYSAWPDCLPSLILFFRRVGQCTACRRRFPAASSKMLYFAMQQESDETQTDETLKAVEPQHFRWGLDYVPLFRNELEALILAV